MTAGENTGIVPDLLFLQHDTLLRVEATERRRRHVRTVLMDPSYLTQTSHSFPVPMADV
jgi:hypothetical protein